MATKPIARALLALLLTGAAGLAPAADLLARLGWMQGCWTAIDGAEAGSGEQWSSPAGGTMMGMSRTIRNGKVADYEFIQIRDIKPGKLGYVVSPSGRPSVTFAALRLGDTEAVFENLGHDFPQRIIYVRDGDSIVRARIEGMNKGVLKGIDFPMKRVSCERS